METLSIPSPHDGLALATYVWEPAGAPKAVVQVAHGMAEHAQRYDRLAQRLTAAGYAVVAHDHRGHGATVDDPKDAGYLADVGGWSAAIVDMRAVGAAARERFAGVPFVLLGHSMGSFLSRELVSRGSAGIDALVLSGTMGDPGALGKVGARVAALEARLRGRRHPSSLMNTLTFGSFNKEFSPARTDFDWLSRDTDEVDAYVADPRCGAVFTSGFFADMLAGVSDLAKDSNAGRIRKDLPIYLLSGSQDPVGGQAAVEAVQAQYERVGLTDVTARVYPQGRHEMFNETNRDEVVDDLVTWLDETVARVG
ncbi:lysophospholipase [Janibacter melonis]|uniref:alpha/beta hydrolase n=1 Tax=Janibacter melonis TaxID=262209 RepID=UPI0020434476|nr:alpha/beta hydrolase [Janibacter melonis]MCM3553622.1 lysophospholipase [Janibacter melonis]